MRLLACLFLLVLLGLPGTGHAARTFDGSTQYAELTTALFTAPSFTICAWARPSTPANDGTVLALINSSQNLDFFVLNFRPYSASAASRTVRARTLHGTGAVATSSGPWTDLVWNHVCGTWGPGTSARSVFLNGGNVGSETSTSVVPDMTGTLRTSLGRLTALTPSAYFDGDLAAVCLWNVVLSASEIAGLGSGATCQGIQPVALIAYVPLWGVASPEPDRAAVRTWPLTGTPPAVASGPPMGRRR